MNLSEAEIQVLASLKEAETSSQPTDRETLERRGRRYGAYKEDWSVAFPNLIDKGLIRGDENRFDLTESGRPLADAYHTKRANETWYYYQRLYPVAHESEAHSRFCERVYGRDLCQDGQTDMGCFDDILERLDLKPGDHVLDVGCGAGGLAEYLSNRTGARVTGIDNSASGIETANARTQGKRDRLTFIEADLNSLDFPVESFDVVISIDSIYWVTSMVDAIASMARSIKPGGQLCILMEQRVRESNAFEVLEAHKTPVALALSALNLDYESEDYTASLTKFWPLARETAEALRDEFARDAAEFICDNWIKYADDIFLPAINANQIRRYLYTSRMSPQIPPSTT